MRKPEDIVNFSIAYHIDDRLQQYLTPYKPATELASNVVTLYKQLARHR